MYARRITAPPRAVLVTLEQTDANGIKEIEQSIWRDVNPREKEFLTKISGYKIDDVWDVKDVDRFSTLRQLRATKDAADGYHIEKSYVIILSHHNDTIIEEESSERSEEEEEQNSEDQQFTDASEE